MSISKVVATFQALLESTGLPGNLLLIATIVAEKRFHVMRYVLLASLAVSDFLWLALVNTFRTASILEERWLFGETICYLNPCLSRYLHINTVLHLVVVSYDRYQAIVKSPLTYSGVVTCNRVALIVLIWTIPIFRFPLALFSTGESMCTTQKYSIVNKGGQSRVLRVDGICYSTPSSHLWDHS